MQLKNFIVAEIQSPAAPIFKVFKNPADGLPIEMATLTNCSRADAMAIEQALNVTNKVAPLIFQ